jgi:hypothetical protein
MIGKSVNNKGTGRKRYMPNFTIPEFFWRNHAVSYPTGTGGEFPGGNAAVECS